MPVISRLPQGGGAGDSYGLFNFPITIQTTQPTPLINGHIWVNSTRGSVVTNATIVSAPTAALSDGTLIFEVYDTRNMQIDVQQKIQMNTPSATLNVSFSANVYGNHPWLVGYYNGKMSTYLAYPRVYIKTGGSIYMETAYVWNGSQWILLCQADSYLITGATMDKRYSPPWYSYTGTPIPIYNRTGATSFSLHSSIASQYDYLRGIGVSQSNGAYCFYYGTNTLNVYKRVGDTFSLYWSLDSTSVLNYLPAAFSNYAVSILLAPDNKMGGSSAVRISGDGTYLAVGFNYSLSKTDFQNNYTGVCGMIIFKNTGSGFSYLRYIDIAVSVSGGGYNFTSNSYIGIAASDDFSVLGAEVRYFYGTNNSSYSPGFYSYVMFGSPESGYSVQGVAGGTNMGCAISPDGTVGVFSYGTGSGNANGDFYYIVYNLNKGNQAVTNIGTAYYRSYYSLGKGVQITPDNYIYTANSINPSTNEYCSYTQGKVVNGAYIPLISTEQYQVITDGAGRSLTNSGGYDFVAMLVDTKNKIFFISDVYGINVCPYTTDSTGKITGYTRTTQFTTPASYGNFVAMAITPNTIY